MAKWKGFPNYLPTQQLATPLSPLLAWWFLDSKKGQGKGGWECQLSSTWRAHLLTGGQSHGLWPVSPLTGPSWQVLFPELWVLKALRCALCRPVLMLSPASYPDSVLHQKTWVQVLTPSIDSPRTRLTPHRDTEKTDNMMERRVLCLLGGKASLWHLYIGLTSVPY